MFVFAVSDFIDKIKGFMNVGIEWFKNLASGSQWWIALIALVVAAILLIIGFIRLIAKTWKVLLVLVILGGIGFAVYYFVVLKGKGSVTTTTVPAAIKLASMFLGI